MDYFTEFTGAKPQRLLVLHLPPTSLPNSYPNPFCYIDGQCMRAEFIVLEQNQFFQGELCVYVKGTQSLEVSSVIVAQSSVEIPEEMSQNPWCFQARMAVHLGQYCEFISSNLFSK